MDRTHDIERSLLEWSDSLLSGDADPRLLHSLRVECGDFRRALLLDSVPDQGEDIYTVAIPPNTVLVYEVSRLNPTEPAILLDRYSFDNYIRQYTSRLKRRRAAVIARLMRDE
jgi:hypothetical protein